MGCGEWKCEYGAWHDSGEKCDCEEKESPARREAEQDNQVTNNNYLCLL